MTISNSPYSGYPIFGYYYPSGYPFPHTINYPSFPLLCVTNSSFIPSSSTNLFQSNFDLSKVPILGALPVIVPIILLSPPGRFWAVCCFSWAFWNCLASFESFSTSLVTLKKKSKYRSYRFEKEKWQSLVGACMAAKQ